LSVFLHFLDANPVGACNLSKSEERRDGQHSV
jgi:hypothetical protein